LVELTENYVGGDIEAICREAGMRALRDDMETEVVSWRHFEDAIESVHSSVTKEMLERYRKMDQTLRRTTEVDAAAHSMYG
ncbi:MAG: hypothetical protein ACXAC0_02350, partial [Candidatus Thorarchaeota archaeon]